MIVRILFVPLAALLVAAEPAFPQPAGPSPPAPSGPPLDAATRHAVIASASQVMIEGYVYEDRARAFAARLAANDSAGRYDALVDRGEFARAVTRDLQEISGDKHLRVMTDTTELAGGPRFVRMPPGGPGGPGGPAPGGAGIRRMAPPGGPMPHPPPGKVPPNDGFARIEILDGNIGYLDLRGFFGTESGRARVDSMMKAFAGAKAMVIDLGRNGGGDGAMVGYLSTYFFDKPTHLVSMQMRGAPEPMEQWTLDEVPGPRFTRPVYVLTSSRTFSAAEAFAFGLKNHGRITLVGEKTGGGGHFGGVERLSGGFALWLPRGRTYDPRTGKGWEADGVAPDIAVPYDQALGRAVDRARAGS